MHMYIYFYIYSIYQWFLNSFCIDWSNLLQIVFEFSEMWLFPEAAFIISVPPSNIWVLMQGSTTRKCKKACCFNHRLAAVPLLKKMWKNPIKTTLVVWYWIDCSCINQYLQHFLLILVCKLVLFSKDSRKGWTSPLSPKDPWQYGFVHPRNPAIHRSMGWEAGPGWPWRRHVMVSPDFGCFLKWWENPNMDGENNGKTLFFNGWSGGKTHYFRKPPILLVLKFLDAQGFWVNQPEDHLKRQDALVFTTYVVVRTRWLWRLHNVV